MLIRYYGHVGQDSGYAIAGAELCMAILEAGLELEISTTGKVMPARYGALTPCIRDEAALSPRPHVVIAHTLPLTCGDLFAQVGLSATGARCIAYTTWEGASPAPHEMVESLERFHEVWVPSHQACDVLVQGGLRSVSVVPHGYDPAFWCYDPVDRPARVGPMGPETTYRFYYIGAWTVRKNPEGLLQAYMRAFTRHDNVVLRMHCTGADLGRLRMAQIATGVPQDLWPQIDFSWGQFSDEGIRDIHATLDCFVTASRGESWNLPAFEAMLMGRHVIAPGRHGSDDFLGSTSAWLYDTHLAPAHGETVLREAVKDQPGTFRAQYIGTQGLSVKADWREPDLGALAVCMRRAYAERIRDLQVPNEPQTRFSRKALATTLRDALID